MPLTTRHAGIPDELALRFVRSTTQASKTDERGWPTGEPAGGLSGRRCRTYGKTLLSASRSRPNTPAAGADS